MTWHDTHRWLTALMRHDASVEACAQALGVSAQRAAVYAQFAIAHVRDALTKNFTRVQRVVGADWEKLVYAYFRAVAPSDWELNQVGRGFPDFIQANGAAVLEDAGRAALLADLARIEWAEFMVYVAPDLVVANAQDAACTAAPSERAGGFGDPQGTIRRLNPTLEAFCVDMILWQVIANDFMTSLIATGEPAWILVYRHPASLQPVTALGTPARLLLIKASVDGVSLAELAAQAAWSPDEVAAHLEHAAREGLFV